MDETGDRYVEVFSEGTYEESIQRLGVFIRISADTKRTESAISEIAHLRDLCIKKLIQAGVIASDIHDAGSGVEQNRYAAKKRSATQVIHVSATDMSVITKAIYSVEPLVQDKRFTINTSMHVPRFEPDEGAVEAAQRRAIVKAKEQAKILAEAAGLTLGNVMQVQQMSPERQQHGYRPYGFDSIGELQAADFTSAPSESGIDTPERTVKVRYRVRFAAIST